MSEWISVKDKLPDLNKVVVISYPSGFDGAPLFAWGARLDGDEGWCWGIQTFCGCGLDPTGDAPANDIECDDDYPVTHWMPLPQPPGAQSGHGKSRHSQADVAGTELRPPSLPVETRGRG